MAERHGKWHDFGYFRLWVNTERAEIAPKYNGEMASFPPGDVIHSEISQAAHRSRISFVDCIISSFDQRQ